MKEDEKKNLEEKDTDESTKKLENINLDDYVLVDVDDLVINDYFSVADEYIETYKKYFGSEPDEITAYEVNREFIMTNLDVIYDSTKEINKEIRKIDKRIPNNIILRDIMEKKVHTALVEFIDKYNDFLSDFRKKLVERKLYLSEHPVEENLREKRMKSIKKDGE